MATEKNDATVTVRVFIEDLPSCGRGQRADPLSSSLQVHYGGLKAPEYTVECKPDAGQPPAVQDGFCTWKAHFLRHLRNQDVKSCLRSLGSGQVRVGRSRAAVPRRHTP